MLPVLTLAVQSKGTSVSTLPAKDVAVPAPTTDTDSSSSDSGASGGHGCSRTFNASTSPWCQRQLQRVQNTQKYLNALKVRNYLPEHLVAYIDPPRPPRCKKPSNRSFKGRVAKWAQKLHVFDSIPKAVPGEQGYNAEEWEKFVGDVEEYMTKSSVSAGFGGAARLGGDHELAVARAL